VTRKNGKHLLQDVLNLNSPNAIPWVPFAGVHAGKLTGYTAREILNDGEKLLQSLLAVYQQYSPDGMPLYFDIQVEAEILGCKLAWAEYSPPSVISHPFSESNLIIEKIPLPDQGRLGLILNVMRQIKQEIGAEVALFGLVTGPLTLAYHLRGNQLFFDVNDNPGYLQDLLQYTTRVSKAIARYYVDTGMDVIGIIEPVASQISPHTFANFLLQNHIDLFHDIRRMGAYSMLHICGNAMRHVDLVRASGTNIFSVDENVDLSAIKSILDHDGIIIQGNLPVSSLLLPGSPQENKDYVTHLLDALPNHHNLILSPGCDMPYDTPIENILAVIDALRNYQIIMPEICCTVQSDN
jgi:uroporphyrinogen decarboxylase